VSERDQTGGVLEPTAWVSSARISDLPSRGCGRSFHPEPRVVGHICGARQQGRVMARKSAKSRIARGTPERGQPRIVTSRAEARPVSRPWRNGELGGQRLQQWASGGGGHEARIAVSVSGIPMWTVQSPDRRSDRIPEQVAGCAVALLVGDRPHPPSPTDASPTQAAPPVRDDRPAQTAERTYRLASAAQTSVMSST